MSQVNIIDPVSPAASAAVGNAGDILMQQATLAAQQAMAHAKIDADAKINEAQIKSQEKMKELEQKGFKDYQGFQAGEAEKERAFKQQEDLSNFAQTKELNDQAATIEKRKTDDLNNMSIRLKQIDYQMLGASDEVRKKLVEQRKPLEKEFGEKQAELMAAGVIFDQAGNVVSYPELVKYTSTVDSMGQQVEGLLTGIGKGAEFGKTLADQVLMRAHQKQADLYSGAGAYGGNVTNPVEAARAGLPTTPEARTQIFKKNVVEEASKAFASDGQMDQQVRPQFEELVGLVVNFNPRDTEGNKQATLARVGTLFDAIQKSDPMTGVAVKAFVDSIGQKALDEKDKSTAALQGSLKEYTSGITGEMLRFVGSKRPSEENQRELISVWDSLAGAGSVLGAAGVTPDKYLNGDALGLAMTKVHTYLGDAIKSGRPITQEGLETTLKGLPPTIVKRVEDFYAKFGVGEAAAGLAEKDKSIKATVKRQADITRALGDLNDEVDNAGGSVRQKANDLLEKLIVP